MKRGSCRVLSNLSEKQALQGEEISKTCWKLPKKRDSFQTKQLSNVDLDSYNKSETLPLYDENDVSMEVDIHLQVFTLNDLTEDDFILTMLCGKKKHFSFTARALTRMKIMYN